MNRRPPILGLLLLVTMTALFALPLVIAVLASFKSPEELSGDNLRLLPREWRPENYSEALSAMPYLQYVRNSLVLCLGCVVGSVFSCSLVAYGLARVEWRGKRLLFAVILSTMLLPWHVTMIPKFLLIRELGLYNSLASLIAPTFLGDAFFIFLLRQFFLTIPQELSEAARLDGCSELGIFWRIVVPLSKPALATVALLQFVATWNDFSGPLIYLSDPARFPLAYGLEQFQSAYSSQTHLLLAATVLFTLPIVALFFLAQRTFLAGISTTGLKG